MENDNEVFGNDLDLNVSKTTSNTKENLPKFEVEVEPPVETPPVVEKKTPGRPKKAELVDDTNPIITPVKEEVKTEIEPPIEEEPEDTGLITNIAAKLGYEFGEEETFEETEEGLTSFVQSAADRLSDAKLNGWLESLPPIASDFFDHLQMLGEDATEDNIKKFFTAVNPEIDYKAIDLNNEDVQKAVVKTMYKKMGWDEADIKETIEDLEVAGTLAKQAKIASAKLAATQESDRTTLMEEQRTKDAAKREGIQKYWNGVDQIIKSGKANGFTIPVTEQKAILDYMSKPTKSGLPQFQEELNSMTQEDRIQLAIAVKNKFNLQKFITAAAKTQVVNGLRDKLKGGATKLKGGAGAGGNVNDEIEFIIK
jgi:hypothetical protein